MKEETLKKRGQLKKTFKKTVLIPGLTCLIIAAQSVPLFGTVSNDALARFADSMSYTITAEAATEAKNQDELAEKYGLKEATHSKDLKYTRTTKEAGDGTGEYYQTIEGYENSADLLAALKDYLGVRTLVPSYVSPSQSDGASATCAATMIRDMCGISSKLTSKSGRQQLAKIGAANTDWINSSWEEAPELTILGTFGVVNDDFGLMKYNSSNRNKQCSREDFYTMWFRTVNHNERDAQIEQLFNSTPSAEKTYASIFGKNYKKRNAVAAVVEDVDNKYTSRFFYDGLTKSNMKAGITRGEVYSLIGDLCALENRPSYNSMKKQLIKAFKDISSSNFTDNNFGDINTKKLGQLEVRSIWSAWKAGYLKPDSKGNMSLTGKMTYKDVVKAICDGCTKAGKKLGRYGT